MKITYDYFSSNKYIDGLLKILIYFYTKKLKKTIMAIASDNGLVLKNSTLDFETTYTKLKNTIEGNPNLKIMIEIDHSKNAASKGLDLRPTRVIIFGNPMLGTVLMQNQASLAIDLPQKIVVYQLEDGTVQIGFNDPLYLKKRHGLVEQDEVLTKISNALNTITDKAIAN